MLAIKINIGLIIFCFAIAAITLDLFLGWQGFLPQRIEPFFLACAFLGVPAGLLILRANYLVKTILSLFAGFYAKILIVIMAHISAENLYFYVQRHLGHYHLPENIGNAVFISALFMLWCFIIASISFLGGLMIRLKEYILFAKANRDIS
ncbi:MAG: hypothetical protein M0R48_04120 [Candidatus Omnitrophica bacterium]|jgi:ABC-type branched-subunit amino acid transport system permease subunit|nr:hypothetical protein [Candidatus Omnitrophota bacterium]